MRLAADYTQVSGLILPPGWCCYDSAPDSGCEITKYFSSEDGSVSVFLGLHTSLNPRSQLFGQVDLLYIGDDEGSEHYDPEDIPLFLRDLMLLFGIDQVWAARSCEEIKEIIEQLKELNSQG